jgi:hypothetical protein
MVPMATARPEGIRGPGVEPTPVFVLLRRARWVAAALAAGLVAALVPGAGRAATGGCPLRTVCVSVGGDQPIGLAHQVAEGFVHGVDASDNPSLVSNLHPRSWVLTANEGAVQSARSEGSAVTYMLTQVWDDTTAASNHGQPVAPWTVLGNYFRFIADHVRAVEAAHQRVDYWEIENEPDGYLAPSSKIRATPGQALAQFETGVAAIRSVDPHARIVGPSLGAYNDQPGSPTLDLVTFLNDMVAHHIRVDAISWHEVGARANLVNNPPDPVSAVVDVQRARALIAARPTLGHPAILISEYSSAADHLIPGWDVGWMASLEQAGVSAANRSCWHAPDVAGQMVAECAEGGLDGLFIPESGLPQAGYLVHEVYANMTGSRLAAGSTDANVSGFATEAGTTIQVLVGRHQSCTPQVRVDCKQQASAVPGPVNVQIQMRVPWRRPSYTVQVERIPNVTGPVLAPTIVSWQGQGAVGGVVPVAISGFADGDAYLVTLSG